jgi:voltage-gated potassium channel
VVIAPQLLGGELLAMLLTGEEVTSEFVMQRVFQDLSGEPADPTKGPVAG